MIFLFYLCKDFLVSTFDIRDAKLFCEGACRHAKDFNDDFGGSIWGAGFGGLFC